VKATKTNGGGGGIPVRHTMALGIVIFLVLIKLAYHAKEITVNIYRWPIICL